MLKTQLRFQYHRAAYHAYALGCKALIGYYVTNQNDAVGKRIIQWTQQAHGHRFKAQKLNPASKMENDV